MYRQLFLNSERKRELLIKDINKFLAVIDKEKDPDLHGKAADF